MPNTSGGECKINAMELIAISAVPRSGPVSTAATGVASRVRLCTLRARVGTLCGPCRKQQLCGSSQAGAPETTSDTSAVSILWCPGQHGRSASICASSDCGCAERWCAECSAGMSTAISCPGRMCPACMASIGAIVISAQAATTSSSTAAVVFFAIPLDPARTKNAGQ